MTQQQPYIKPTYADDMKDLLIFCELKCIKYRINIH